MIILCLLEEIGNTTEVLLHKFTDKLNHVYDCKTGVLLAVSQGN